MQLPAGTDPSLRSKADISGGIPQSGVPAFKLIDGQLDQVKELINKQLAGCSESFGRLLATFNSCSGKMLRPGLVLLSYCAVSDTSRKKETQHGIRKGSQTQKKCVDPILRSIAKWEPVCGPDTQYEAIRIAAIVEMIHNATLLHDDVIDEGQKRRGRPTINSLWGNESAVLLGDFLLSQVFRMCADLQPQITKIIADTTARICGGELRQIISSCRLRDSYCAKRNTQYDLSESEYIDIITEKSAALFSSACYLGAFLAGASEPLVSSLACFGRDLGIAFQITDDLLDIIGDESKTGKTLGSDVDKNKLTLAAIHLLRSANNQREKAAVKSKLSAAAESKNALAEMLIRYGSLEYTRNRAQEFVTKAVQALAELKESDAKQALIETAEFVVRRTI